MDTAKRDTGRGKRAQGGKQLPDRLVEAFDDIVIADLRESLAAMKLAVESMLRPTAGCLQWDALNTGLQPA